MLLLLPPAGDSPTAMQAGRRRVGTLVVSSALYLQVAPFGPPAFELVSLAVAVALLGALLRLFGGLFGLRRRGSTRSRHEAPSRTELARGFGLYLAILVLAFLPATSRPFHALLLADTFSGTLVAKSHLEGMHDAPVVTIDAADGSGRERFRVVEPTWQLLAVGDHVEKQRGDAFADVDGTRRRWVPFHGRDRWCGVKPYDRPVLATLLFVAACLGIAWVIASALWHRLRKHGPLRLAGEDVAQTEGVLEDFGWPEDADPEEGATRARNDPSRRRPFWRRPRWSYRFDILDPDGVERLYRGEEPAARRDADDLTTAMKVGQPVEVCYATGDPRRSRLSEVP